MSTRYQLVMRNGPNPGAVFPLDSEFITIGRDPSNGIAVNDPEISRQHAKLMQQGGRIVIQDNGSTNGTLINGNRIAGPHVLKTGEMISLGEDIVFLFEAITFDPDATLLSSSPPSPPAAPRQKPIAPTSPPPQARPQAYAGQIPTGPAPIAPPPPASQVGKRVALPVALGIGGLVLICACGGFFWWVDATSNWCTLFPFLFGAACG